MIKRPLNVQKGLETHAFPENGENASEGVPVAWKQRSRWVGMDHNPKDHIMEEVRKVHFRRVCVGGASMS